MPGIVKMEVPGLTTTMGYKLEFCYMTSVAPCQHTQFKKKCEGGEWKKMSPKEPGCPPLMLNYSAGNIVSHRLERERERERERETEREREKCKLD
jgi:hypothetical protein